MMGKYFYRDQGLVPDSHVQGVKGITAMRVPGVGSQFFLNRHANPWLYKEVYK